MKLSEERSPSGRWRTLGKRVYRKVSRVRIPLSPHNIITALRKGDYYIVVKLRRDSNRSEARSARAAFLSGEGAGERRQASSECLALTQDKRATRKRCERGNPSLRQNKVFLRDPLKVPLLRINPVLYQRYF